MTATRSPARTSVISTARARWATTTRHCARTSVSSAPSPRPSPPTCIPTTHRRASPSGGGTRAPARCACSITTRISRACSPSTACAARCSVSPSTASGWSRMMPSGVASSSSATSAHTGAPVISRPCVSRGATPALARGGAWRSPISLPPASSVTSPRHGSRMRRGAPDPRQWRLVSRLATSETAPITTSAGRLFDAVASLLGVAQVSTFEAEAAMRLEALAASAGDLAGRRGTGHRSLGDPLVLDTVAPGAGLVARAAARPAGAELAAIFHEGLRAWHRERCVPGRHGPRRRVVSR